ncbi:MAG TPA: hypothetical protein VGA99_10055, partial [bacterium]
MSKSSLFVGIALVVNGILVFLLSQQVWANNSETPTVTIVTITSFDGDVFTFTEQAKSALTISNQPNVLCEGEWSGNDVSFKLLDQTAIDTFKITFRNLGGCNTIEVKSSPVAVAGNTFNVSYNIPTISSGSLSGTFSANGSAVSGTFSYTNIQCNGSQSGAWSAQAVVSCDLAAPANLTAVVTGAGVELEWQAPGTPAAQDTAELFYDDGTAEDGIVGNFD